MLDVSTTMTSGRHELVNDEFLRRCCMARLEPHSCTKVAETAYFTREAVGRGQRSLRPGLGTRWSSSR